MGQVTAALSEYLSAVQDTENTVKLELQALSDVLVRSNDLPVIAQVNKTSESEIMGGGGGVGGASKSQQHIDLNKIEVNNFSLA